MNGRVIAFMLAVTVVTGLLASIVPAVVTARRDFGRLVSAGRASGARERLRLLRTLIGVQVALATMLLIGAGLFVTSLRNVRGIDLGLDVDRILYVKLDGGAPGQKSQDPTTNATTAATYNAMLERVRAVPGVVRASLTAGEPFASGWGISLQRRGGAPPAPGTPVPFGRAVGADYFETMGTRLVRGRFFNAEDHRSGKRVAIIDESMAKQYWPNGDPLDPCVYLGSDQACTEIVGVVANTVLWDVVGDKGFIVYVPIESDWARGITMMEVRTSRDPAALIAPVRRAVHVGLVRPALGRHSAGRIADSTRSCVRGASARRCSRRSGCSRSVSRRWGSMACSRTASRSGRMKSAFEKRWARPTVASFAWCSAMRWR